MNNEEKILEMLAAINKRLDTLERTTATKEDLDRVLVESKVMQEGYFDPKFNLLADGQKLIREKMLPAEAIEDVEDRVDVLEIAVKEHAREIQELKRA